MTETEVQTESLGELQKELVHLKGVSEDGWVLQWGDSPKTTFEVVARGVNKLQVEKLEALITKAHAQAETNLH